MQTTWNQAPHYNAQCPGGSVTGCVATAMAQIMKFWNHPATGSGFHQFNHPQYGTLAANFGGTTYAWGSMPNNVSSANSAVATLMYHCGGGVDMQYSPEVSGAWVIQSHSPSTDHNAEYALRTYFGYRSTLSGVARENYAQAQWIDLLRTELDAGRPILYDGFGDGGGTLSCAMATTTTTSSTSTGAGAVLIMATSP
ncbi:MAG: C10 family peptidase [Flavobacteriales bacterium]|nr:C10 family peptidase [Flavobacteriales bacterium]